MERRTHQRRVEKGTTWLRSGAHSHHTLTTALRSGSVHGSLVVAAFLVTAQVAHPAGYDASISA